MLSHKGITTTIFWVQIVHLYKLINNLLTHPSLLVLFAYFLLRFGQICKSGNPSPSRLSCQNFHILGKLKPDREAFKKRLLVKSWFFPDCLTLTISLYFLKLLKLSQFPRFALTELSLFCFVHYLTLPWGNWLRIRVKEKHVTSVR